MGNPLSPFTHPTPVVIHEYQLYIYTLYDSLFRYNPSPAHGHFLGYLSSTAHRPNTPVAWFIFLYGGKNLEPCPCPTTKPFLDRCAKVKVSTSLRTSNFRSAFPFVSRVTPRSLSGSAQYVHIGEHL